MRPPTRFRTSYRLLLGVACALATLWPAVGRADPTATYPAWWLSGNLVAAQPPLPTDGNYSAWVQKNYQPANLGQLKNVAAKAQAYFGQQFALLGGNGTAVDALVGNFSTNATMNYKALNLGQLKAVAQVFYDRLLAVGYNSTANLIAQGYPSGWSSNYPWATPPPGPGQGGYNSTTYNAWIQANYQPANLGQLKLVFSFDLSLNALNDSDSDGLPDWWEMAFFGTLGEGLSGYANHTAVLAAYAAGTSPIGTITVVIATPASGQTF